ncbi:type II secretion system F family protein [Terrabacter ginsenosidimutans]
MSPLAPSHAPSDALAVVTQGSMLAGLVAAGLAAAAVLVLLGGRHEADGSSGSVSAAHPDVGAEGTGGADTVPSSPPSSARRQDSPVSPVSPDGQGREATRGRGLRFLRRGQDDQAEADDAQVSSALALLALAYRSGLPTWDVLEAVAAGLTGRASTDLRQVATALRWGASEAEAWASVGHVWAPAARAVAIAHQAGVPPGAMLLAASDDLREAELERLEISAAKVGVRLVAPLGLVLLPAFCLNTVAPLVIALAGDLMSG